MKKGAKDYGIDTAVISEDFKEKVNLPDSKNIQPINVTPPLTNVNASEIAELINNGAKVILDKKINYGKQSD